MVALVLRLRLGFVLLGRLGLELFSLGFLLVGGGRVVVGSWGRLVLGLLWGLRLRLGWGVIVVAALVVVWHSALRRRLGLSVVSVMTVVVVVSMVVRRWVVSWVMVVAPAHHPHVGVVALIGVGWWLLWVVGDGIRLVTSVGRRSTVHDWILVTAVVLTIPSRVAHPSRVALPVSLIFLLSRTALLRLLPLPFSMFFPMLPWVAAPPLRSMFSLGNPFFLLLCRVLVLLVILHCLKYELFTVLLWMRGCGVGCWFGSGGGLGRRLSVIGQFSLLHLLVNV